ncbi:hypothetical protein [Oceanobacillus chungangensis]|uniref:Uncharacterized protein n=1 Tax=Oceanobacillus chungangensis TaxID=1229152 RepID=A0A3D8PX42_9BACI|nr:hypothetical protein [Oceanobacillus chungangensis]RDW19881.1 hypothetical protein CWR45_07410 [Oceanobacillus chungangensis]
MKHGFDQNGRPITVYDGNDLEAVGKGIGFITWFLLGYAAIIFVASLFFTLYVLADSFIFSLIEKLFPLKIWFFLAEIDHWIGIRDNQIQKSVFIILMLTILFFILYRVWKKHMKPGAVKTIGKLWIVSNIAILMFRLPLYVILSIYIALVGIDDFHLYDQRDIEYVENDNAFYANHSDATIDVYHSEIFDTKTVKDINGTEYDDYIVVTSGEQPNSEEPGYWAGISFNLFEKVNEISFIGSFMENMKVSEDNPLVIKVKTDRDSDKEKVIFEKTFTDINQIEQFEIDVNGAEIVDILISSEHEFNFGIFEFKKYMVEE